MGRPSYWLKIDRADKHLKEIKALLAPYEKHRPYTVSHGIEGKEKAHVYRVAPSESPDPEIAIVMGDFLFNLRSSLDHLRVALVPRGRRYNGAFPIFTQDIWGRDSETRQYLEGTADSRQFWETSVKGMDERAIRQIDNLQPFRFPSDQIRDLSLSILNRLNNADKHRELVTVANFMRPLEVTIHSPDGSRRLTVGNISGNQPFGSGTVVARLDSEARVEVSGSLQVTIGAGQQPGGFGGYPVAETADTMIEYIRSGLIPLLEPFVQ